LGRCGRGTRGRLAAEFAEHSDFNYDLACYACLVGEYGEAKQVLEKALTEADEKLKLKALADPNLAELWKRIGSL
jgi:hypothetical protein